MTDNWNDLSSDEISVKLIEQLSSMMPGGAEALSSAIEAYSEQSADCCSSEPGADASDCRPQASAFESEPADAGLDGCAS
ncbi:hypothetical protein IJT17_03810, partial [bacterium]|nr:hypothetical protein [bacterium]